MVGFFNIFLRETHPISSVLQGEISWRACRVEIGILIFKEAEMAIGKHIGHLKEKRTGP